MIANMSKQYWTDQFNEARPHAGRVIALASIAAFIACVLSTGWQHGWHEALVAALQAAPVVLLTVSIIFIVCVPAVHIACFLLNLRPFFHKVQLSITVELSTQIRSLILSVPFAPPRHIPA